MAELLRLLRKKESAPQREEEGTTEMAKRILVVDDDEMVLIALKELLGFKGYETRVVSGGAEALDALREQVFDLVILDIIMPGMDGYEVCRKIRREERWRTLPVVMLTAMSGEEDRKKGEEAGADPFLLTVYFFFEYGAIVSESESLRLKALAQIQASTLDLFLSARRLNLVN